MSSSPGPAIVNLPTTIGEEKNSFYKRALQYDPTGPKAAGYKIGQRILEDKGQGIGPGPGTYCIRDVTNKGKGAIFASKFGISEHFDKKLADYGGSPGPAFYLRDSADNLIYPRPPTYSVPHDERSKMKIATDPILGICSPNLQQTQRSLTGLHRPSRYANNAAHVQGHAMSTSSCMTSVSRCLPKNLQHQQPSYSSLFWNTCRAYPTNRSMQDMERIVGPCVPLGGNLPTSEEYFGRRDRSFMFNESSIAEDSNRTSLSRSYLQKGLMNNSLQPNTFSSSRDLSGYLSLTNQSTDANSNLLHNPVSGRPAYGGSMLLSSYANFFTTASPWT